MTKTHTVFVAFEVRADSAEVAERQVEMFVQNDIEKFRPDNFINIWVDNPNEFDNKE